MSDTDWIVEGAEVAEFRQEWSSVHVALSTVERLTATQVVLDNGRRYRRDTGRIVGEGRGELLPPSNQRVRDALADVELAGVRHRVNDLCKDHRGGVTAVLSTLDLIQRAVDEARANVEG